ncbi:MAG: tetratricopeptide repeat protein, partial [Planctomycetota bacterium]
QVRRGLAAYLAGDFAGAGQSLETLAPTLGDPLLSAEAWHWVGASRLQQKQLDAAVVAFDKSRAASGSWRRAAETLSLLAQAQASRGDAKAAEQTLAELKQKFPEHRSAADAELRLAKQAFAAGEFARALEIYNRLLPVPSPEISPHALYDSAWCLTKLAPAGETESRLNEARSRFAKVYADYPKHELAPLALLGVAAVERQAGRPVEALAALDQFLQGNAEHPRVVDARYERGLVLGDLKRWSDAVTAWQELAAVPAAKALGDRIAYELAWALRESGNLDASNQEFERIARDYPQSPIAADAFFQLGERDYAASKFAEAASWYEKCLAGTPAASLGERALYKLGFTQFRTKDFTRSLATFQRQVKDFPQGELHADGMFMVGESLFEAKQYDSALSAYRAAKPLLETSNRVKPENRWLTLLHAAQSANKQKDYAAAVELAKELADDAQADAGLRLDASLELGNAYQQLGQIEPAVEAWTKASA